MHPFQIMYNIVALITKHQDAKNHLNISILNPLIENSDTYLQTIDLLVEKHQQLVDQLQYIMMNVLQLKWNIMRHVIASMQRSSDEINMQMKKIKMAV